MAALLLATLESEKTGVETSEHHDDHDTKNPPASEEGERPAVVDFPEGVESVVRRLWSVSATWFVGMP